MQELLRGIGHRVLTYNQAVPIAGDFFVSHEDGTKQPLYLTLALELLSNRELLEACIDFSGSWSASERLCSSRAPNRFDLLQPVPSLALENPPALLAQHDRVNNLEFEVTISQLTAEHQTHCQYVYISVPPAPVPLSTPNKRRPQVNVVHHLIRSCLALDFGRSSSACSSNVTRCGLTCERGSTACSRTTRAGFATYAPSPSPLQP